MVQKIAHADARRLRPWRARWVERSRPGPMREINSLVHLRPYASWATILVHKSGLYETAASKIALASLRSNSGMRADAKGSCPDSHCSSAFGAESAQLRAPLSS